MSTKRKLRSDDEIQQKKSKKRYGCTICEKTFPRKWNLNNHLRIHEETRLKAKCPYCDSKFFDESNFRQHCLIRHPRRNVPKSLMNLKWEPESKEISDGMPFCAVCHKSFTREENLAYHLMSYHPNHINKKDETDTERKFEKINSNQYLSTKKRMLIEIVSKCNCLADAKCGEDCINRLLFHECRSDSSKNCTNKTIQTSIPHSIEVFITRDKGWGVRAKKEIKSGSFLIEYVGDVISSSEFKNRMNTKYSDDTHHYGIHIESGYVIDARDMGNESRFINHSCQPNCEVQKWIVNGLPCMAIFAIRNIPKGEEITIDYKFQLYSGSEGKACKCNEKNCTGILGKKVRMKQGMKGTMYKFQIDFSNIRMIRIQSR